MEFAAASLLPATQVRTFAAPWTRKGRQVLLACGKCQRKLKGRSLSNLRKALKKRAKATGTGVQFTVLETKCLDVCPRGGVVVCTQAQLGAGQAAILRSKRDLDLVTRACAPPGVE